VFGETLTLNEMGENKKPTGVFILKLNEDTLSGIWKDKIKHIDRNVKLIVSSVKYLKTAKIPKSSSLILSDNKSLEEEILEYTEESQTKPKLKYFYAERSILGTYFHWTFYGAYFTEGVIYHTFDLNTNKELKLVNEIRPELIEAVKNELIVEIKNKLEVKKQEFDEKTWVEIFGSKEDYLKAFNVIDIDNDIFDSYFIKNNYIVIEVIAYFDLPKVSQFADINMEFKIPFNKFKQIIKSDSRFSEL
jgi:hypothetical protein